MKFNERFVFAVGSIVLVIGAGLWAQGDVPAGTPIITGPDIGFQVSPSLPGQDAAVAGRLVVRVNGRWMASSATITLVPAAAPGTIAQPARDAAAGQPPAPDSSDVLRPGAFIKSPAILLEVKPTYTQEAIRAKVRGTVQLEITVRRDGTVDPDTIVVTKSFDPDYGLNQQAIEAAKHWTFKPGVVNATGVPVNVRVHIEMTFTLR